MAEEALEPAVHEEPVAEEASAAEDHDPAPGFSLGGAAELDAPASAADAVEDEPMELSQVAATYDDTSDELVLDAREAPAEYQPAGAPVADAGPAEESAARSTGGGTLFERMSRLSRGASPPEGEAGDKEDGVDIPRFLGRQNNQ